MKTLLILRHAKSSWATPTIADHDRPLNSRGKADAPRIGDLIKKQDLTPDLILCSTAKRARKTAAKVATNCGYADEVQRVGELYLASADIYLNVLAEFGDAHNRVMVVGHNPGLEDLVETLTGEFVTLPTAALVHVSLAIEHWRELDKSVDGTLVTIWRPRELSE